MSYFTFVFMLFFFEFSYSSVYEDLIYQMIVTFKILQMFIDIGMASLLRENFLIAPIMVCIEVTEVVVTLGASDFLDFVISYFVELSIMIFERVFLDPGLKTVGKLMPKWNMMLRRRFAKKRHMTREQRAKEEAEWKRINEEIALESEGVEPLLDAFGVYANET